MPSHAVVRQDEVFQRVRDAADETPVTPLFPTAEDVRAAQEALGVTFPPSYAACLLELSTLSVGRYELLLPKSEWPYLNLLPKVEELRTIGLPTTFVPFVIDNGDAFCFDIRSPGPEYAVVLWAHHDESVIERFPDFLSWVEERWLPTAAHLDDDEDE